MKAIDLYSGSGGWRLGFQLAGIDVCCSYEIWDKAVKTNNINFNDNCSSYDIRNIKKADIPTNVEFVIGSPPCTEFSYANRGGSGNIKEGLIDVYQFLKVVDWIKPRYWAMENVPRVAKILESELEKGGVLHKYKNLFSCITVLDMSEWGVPQKRKRTIAGNFPINLLLDYKNTCRRTTLGEVLSAIQSDRPRDILYNYDIEKDEIFDNDTEECLSKEELRLNKTAKEHHSVYNIMQFPEPFDSPVRTITATCTRVSRESIIIKDFDNEDCYRRLSVRERALLQGFPITFQFYGDNHSQKLKLVGNAVPPFFTYYIANSFLEVPVKQLKHPWEIKHDFKLPNPLPKKTFPDTKGKTYPSDRKFRMAIPGARFGSGVRFDFENFVADSKIEWRIVFVYGNSKNFKQIIPSSKLIQRYNLQRFYTACIDRIIHEYVQIISQLADEYGPIGMQEAWTRRITSVHPFEVLDLIAKCIDEVKKEVECAFKLEALSVASMITGESSRKMDRISGDFLAGFLVSSKLNSLLNILSD